jgi:hypothetical protein
MKINENAVFIAVFLIAIGGGLVFYGMESQTEKAHPVAVANTTLSATISHESLPTSSTSSSTTISSTSVPTVPTTSLETTTSSIPSTTTTSATSTASTSTYASTTTPARSNPLLDKLKGKGYHQAYLDVQYFCPSCVPAVVAMLSNHPGVMSKSLSYRQPVSFVIYDPKVVKLEHIIELAGASGGATLINDTTF